MDEIHDDIDVRHSKAHNGFEDGFTPLKSLDLSKTDSFSKLTDGMKLTAFGGRQLGEAVDVLMEMMQAKDCLRVLTLSGAMTIAKQGLIVCDLIDRGVCDIIISTGALMAHGFVEASGMNHFKYDGNRTDVELCKMGYDRVYDTLELETNLDEAEDILKEVFDRIPRDEEVGSHQLNWEMGKLLEEKFPGRGILKSAWKRKVPIYIPAFTDSEFGLDLAIYNMKKKLKGKAPIKFNPLIDLHDYTNRIFRKKFSGILTIGGGVPRNWAQQVGPYLDAIRFRFKKDAPYFAKKPKENPFIKGFRYAVRICPEPVHWGGLSGCTYSEGVSWGKFEPKEKGGRFAEVLCDATIAWPLVTKALFEKMDAAGLPEQGEIVEAPDKDFVETIRPHLTGDIEK